MAQKSSNALLWVVVVVLVVLGIVYFSGNDSSPIVQKIEEAKMAEIPEGPIVLGAMDPLTGEGAVYGIPLQNATMLAVEEINAMGGVRGHQIELIWEDSKCNPQDGTAAAQKLVEVDKVSYIISGDCSGGALAAAEITEPAGVMLFSAAASSPDLSDAGDLVFRSYPSDAMAGQVIATYALKELGVMNTAILSELTDYAQGLHKSFASSVDGLGGEVLEQQTYTTGDTDFRTQILKLKSANPEFIFISPQTPVSGIQILKQMHESGVTAIIAVSDTMLGTDTIKDNTGLYKNVYATTPELDKSREITQRFLDNYQARFGNEPEFPAYMAAAYDQVYMLKQAFEEVGLNPTDVRDWLYDVQDWPGALGDVSFDENGDPIIGYNIKHIIDGVMTDLGPYSP